jgi:hypothetical protein
MRDTFSEDTQISNSMKSRPVACVRTDRHDKGKSRSSQICEELVTMESKNMCSVTRSTTYQSCSHIMCKVLRPIEENVMKK